MDNPNLNQVQFRFTHRQTGAAGHWDDSGWVEDDPSLGMHVVNASVDGDENLGSLTWKRGVIQHIAVAPEWRRQGVATQMFQRAREITPGLRHDANRTDDGEAWARTAGGDLPQRRATGRNDNE